MALSLPVDDQGFQFTTILELKEKHHSFLIVEHDPMFLLATNTEGLRPVPTVSMGVIRTTCRLGGVSQRSAGDGDNIRRLKQKNKKYCVKNFKNI